MADTPLTNLATLSGSYADVPFTPFDTNLSTVLLAEITIEKAANRTHWFQGNLIYTITITNGGDETLSDLDLTDQLDYDLVRFVDGSVQINGAAHPDATISPTGLLTITNIPDINAGGDLEITFQVTRYTP